MIYLNEAHIYQIGIDWKEIVTQIEEAVRLLKKNDYAQPIKPYLRYRNFVNRIIAMPAFIGGSFNISGIKWIASFPDNIKRNIPRAHSVVILNDADTGQPVAIINTALLSIIRTAAVSGLIINWFDKARPLRNCRIGIIGWGPIGQNHLRMSAAILGEKIQEVVLYDLRPIDKDKIDFFDPAKIRVANNWQDCYLDSDIVMTCTVSKAPYIDQKPKKGALLLNVSLRDYEADIYDYVKKSVIVDDWDEVCRENTDIENMHRKKGLQKEDTKSIIDVVCGDCLKEFAPDESIMFNPMGMAVFDITVGAYYLSLAKKKHIGNELD
jgi:2,3-diaminopropionate biosynthesis protein SbnB